MQIQQMTIDHIKDVQKIAILSWHKTYELLIPQEIREQFLAAAYSEDTLIERLARSPFYVARLGQKIVGFANFSNANDQQEIELNAIYVHPQFEHQGIGSKLLQYAELILSPKAILVNVELGNTNGYNFYLAKGFTTITQFEENFEGHHLQTIRMKKNLLSIYPVTNCEQILNVIHAAFKRYETDPMPSSALSETALTIEQDLENGLLIFGATVEQNLVGVIKVMLHNDSLYFSRLAVLPTEQGKGIASSLIAYIENFATEKNISAITCKVRKSETDNIRLYLKLGYKITKEEISTSPLGFVMETVTMKKKVPKIHNLYALKNLL